MGGSFHSRARTRGAMAPDETLASARLRYRLMREADADAFHSLAVDEHIRRYLLDGALVDRDWAVSEIRRARDLLARRGVGLWLVFEAEPAPAAAARSPGLTAGDAPRDAPDAPEGAPIGFCGFRVFEEMCPGPQLLYAFLEPYTGRGYATEAGRAMVEHATGRAGMTAIDSAVDEPNRASIRVLDRLGFRQVGQVPGAFGPTVLFRLEAPAGSPGARAGHPRGERPPAG